VVSQELLVSIVAVAIGPFLDFEDLYGTWDQLREVEEQGCVLACPDLYVGWRSASLAADPAAALRHAMRSLLSLN
jgi:2,4-dichlorophenol 6-monooxygenase